MPERFSSVERHIPQAERQRAAEQIFGDIIMSRILNEFSDALEDVGYEPEQIEDIKKELGGEAEEDRKAALAIPEEIRERYLEKLKNKSPHELVQTLIENGKKYGFSIGYHVSPSAAEGTTIIGKEEDHRDSDLPRAYYSTDYKHLYLKKKGNYLYAVRAETGSKSSHRQDNDESWGRASTLAIISRFNLPEVRTEVERKVHEYEQQKIEEAASNMRAAA